MTIRKNTKSKGVSAGTSWWEAEASGIGNTRWELLTLICGRGEAWDLKGEGSILVNALEEKGGGVPGVKHVVKK